MKKMILPIIALILGVGFSAFTKPNAGKVHKRTGTTYVYMGDNTLAQQRLEENYVKDNDALPCSGSEQKICLIVTATDEGDTPDFSSGNPVDNPTQFDQISKRPFN
jgi:hypothetical protein